MVCCALLSEVFVFFIYFSYCAALVAAARLLELNALVRAFENILFELPE